jgi:cytochrome c
MSKNLVKKLSIVAGLVLVMSSSVVAADGAALYTSKGCGACHGADGKTPIMPAYPKIAGQGKEYAAQQMADIKSGKRSNGQSAAMKGIMAGVSEDEIKAIAEYISGL